MPQRRPVFQLLQLPQLQRVVWTVNALPDVVVFAAFVAIACV